MPRGVYERKTHDPTPRFMQKAQMNERGCWIWTAHKDRNGYGQFGVSRRLVYAHRWAYERFRSPIPDGMQLDHLCRTPSCVNPWHLEAVTPRINVLRGEGRPAKLAAATACINGHAFTPENTYRRRDRNNGRHCRQCKKNQDRKYREARRG